MIRVKEVSVIGDDGEHLGTIPTEEALSIAEDKGMDLVEVAANSNPPVCRIMDYGKHKYKASKKAHEAKKNQKIVHVKEVKFRPNTCLLYTSPSPRDATLSPRDATLSRMPSSA